MPKFIAVIAVLLVFCAALPTSAQDLPDEIRGYKVHEANIIVTNRRDSVGDREPDAIIRVGDPVIADTSLKGLTIEVTCDLETLGNSGSVDFLLFKDFKVNGMAVAIDEYNHGFDFKKKTTVVLPQPVSVFVGTLQTLRGALGEIRDSKPEWEVTGKVFVFGKFKKWGMKFKRVIPVEVRLTVQNPIRSRKIFFDQ